MLIVANWKAYIEKFDEAKRLVAVAKRLAATRRVRIVLAPPAPLLGALAGKALVQKRSGVGFAAQDISATTGGAQTGEATAAAFAAAGAGYALIGHSERRAAGDTDTIVAEKLGRAIAQGLVPILCIGEEVRDAEGRYLGALREQLTAALAPIAPAARGKVLIAYEPVWAINKKASAALGEGDLAEMVLYIRKVLAELLPGGGGRATVLYGGSVEPGNARALAAASRVDGFLVGHASVDARSFAALVKEVS